MRFERRPIEGGFILADAALSPEPEWFNPDYWKRRGAGRGLGTGRGVAVSAGPQERWVLRHYRRGGFPGRIVADSYLWSGEERTRPVRELRVLAELCRRGAPVPRPVAAHVERHGMFYQGDLITERIADATTLADRASSLPEDGWKRVGCALRRFHDAGGCHADLNARNVLLAPADVFVVDLDRGTIVKPGSTRQRYNLARLERSLHKLGLLPTLAPGWRAMLAAYAQRSV